MSCDNPGKPVEVVQGSVEYLYVDLRADRVLDTQAVDLSFSTTNDPGTWIPGSWVGNPGEFRSASVLLDGTLPEGMYTVYARITDGVEMPIIRAGRLKII